MEKLRICIISKYPPIQGGMSASAYWLARGLARAGVEVHIVTDGNLVEDEYRINDKAEEDNQGVTVHFVESKLPWYIPHTEQRLAKLVDTALLVCKNHEINIVDAQYLVPYGFTGSIINSFTGIPYIIRHGGSDIAKFLTNGYFPLLMDRTLRNAAVIVSDNPVLSNNAKCVKLPRYVPDNDQFKFTRKKDNSITCAYIGKINYYWRNKGLHKIANMVKGSGIRMLYLSQGKGEDDFKQKCKPEGVFFHFIHPSKMPNFLNEVDFLFYFQDENPIIDFSNIVLEAVSMGIPILTDRVDLFVNYQVFFEVDEWIIRLGPSLAGEELASFLKKVKKPMRIPFKIDYDFFIKDNIALYKKALEKSG